MPIEELPIGEIKAPASEIGLALDPTTMIFIIIPVAVGATLFLLKRMDKLDMITEKNSYW